MSEKQVMYIDGIPAEIEGEKNILELCKKIGIDLPTFCYSPELSIYGACRMCLVENERGSLEAACSTPPRAEMKVWTNTPKLRKYRKNILELLLSNHCRDCTTCEKSTDCKLQEFAKRYQLTDVRFPNKAVSLKDEDPSSLSIVRDNGKCILCGECVRVCNEVQKVGAIDFAFRGSKMKISTAFGMPIAESPCVGCGQCAAICPTGAITVKNDLKPVWDAIADPETRVTVQVAPAVRVGLGKELGVADKENMMGKIVAALRRIGFDAVYDTTLSADLTVMEETAEFLERLEKGGTLPLISSCCPGWIQFAEKKFPEFIPNISTCRSPMQMLSSLLKEQDKKEGRKSYHVAIMPCTAKKFEAARPEFTKDGAPDTDKVLSTKELIMMIKQAGINFDTLQPEKVDEPFDTVSGAGVIFGVTGGVTEAVLRRVAAKKTNEELTAIAKVGQRGMEGIKEFEVPVGEATLKIAVVSGLGNADTILRRVKAGEHFDFIEIMACPGGCVNGGGQPYDGGHKAPVRAEGLYKADADGDLRFAQDNPALTKLYDEIVCGKAHELLHVEYGK